MIKVLVVDDHDLVRTGITRMLADIEGLQVVGQADCGEDCLKLARELKPDVVLMDVKMPGIGGLEATRKLLRSQPTSRSWWSPSARRIRSPLASCRPAPPAT
ncbi:response regulator GacA [Pseudomonas aeruginosa]|nr:response regulator GacA [Pseudomonas aeruginosa]